MYAEERLTLLPLPLEPFRYYQFGERTRRRAVRGDHRDMGELGVKRILGVRSLLRRYGPIAVDDACAAALEMGVPEYRCVRRYLERQPRPPMALRKIDPLIRELTHYPDQHQPHDQGDLMNLVELDRALRQLRLGGMATVLESRLPQAQTERLAPIDLISLLVSDELRGAPTAYSTANETRPTCGTGSAPSTTSTSNSTRR